MPLPVPFTAVPQTDRLVSHWRHSSCGVVPFTCTEELGRPTTCSFTRMNVCQKCSRCLGVDGCGMSKSTIYCEMNRAPTSPPSRGNTQKCVSSTANDLKPPTVVKHGLLSYQWTNYFYDACYFGTEGSLILLLEIRGSLNIKRVSPKFHVTVKINLYSFK